MAFVYVTFFDIILHVLFRVHYVEESRVYLQRVQRPSLRVYAQERPMSLAVGEGGVSLLNSDLCAAASYPRTQVIAFGPKFK